MLEKLKEILERTMDKPVALLTFGAVFLSVIGIRIFVENFIAVTAGRPEEVLTEYLHNFFFFGLALLIIWLFLGWWLKIELSRLARPLLWSSLLIIFPPLLDMLKTGGKVFWSFYLLSSLPDLGLQFLTVFGRLPSGIVYFGTKIVFLSVIILSGFLLYLKSQKMIKSLLGAFGVYVILFFMGSFPSWLSFLYYSLGNSLSVGQVRSFHMAQFLGSSGRIFGLDFNNFKYNLAYNLDLVYFLLLLAILSLFFFLSARRKFWAILKNSRFPQIILHIGPFFAGMGLGYLVYPDNFQIGLFPILAVFCLILSLIFSWLASVVFNDIWDLETDQLTNASRPLVKKVFEKKEYQELGFIFFILALLGALVVAPKFMFITLIYQILAWFYSGWPLRLKRFLVVATFLSSLVLMLALFMGFALLSGPENLQNIQWRVIFLLILAFTFSLPLKDFKDIEGDRQMGVWTIPVIFGEELGRIIVGAGIFLSFVLSIFFLNERDLFFWAVILGSIAFLIVVSEKIKTRQLIWWILPVVAAYSLIVIKVALLK